MLAREAHGGGDGIQTNENEREGHSEIEANCAVRTGDRVCVCALRVCVSWQCLRKAVWDIKQSLGLEGQRINVPRTYGHCIDAV
jgi:hypothetical protein